VGKLTLEATIDDGKRTYLAHGRVDFFGEAEMLHSRGAGGTGMHDTAAGYFLG
jgi:hypothetical protein